MFIDFELEMKILESTYKIKREVGVEVRLILCLLATKKSDFPKGNRNASLYHEEQVTAGRKCQKRPSAVRGRFLLSFDIPRQGCLHFE